MPATIPDPRSISDPARPPLVFAACQPPYPLDNGARIRTHNLLTGLSKAFEAVFVTFELRTGSPAGPRLKEQLEQLYPDVEVIIVPATGGAKRADQAISLLRRRSWTNGRYVSRGFSEAVRRAVAARPFCIVHFDDLGVAQVGPQAGAFNVYSSHNVEAQILRHCARAGRLPRRFFYALEALKVGSEERRVLRSMDLSLAVSTLDGQALSAGGARRVELCPNGAPPVERLPFPLRSADEPMRLLFVGTGSYVPYERGLAWFVREVLPRIAARAPVRVDVVGNPPARPVEATGVRYVGRVPSVESFYSASHGVIVPVFEGSGTRLKILEAVAYGRPVISTGLGAEGLPVVADEHFLQADDAESFAGAALRLADWSEQPEGGEVERLVASAREATRGFFWPEITERLVELYRSELERRLASDLSFRTASPSERVWAGHPLR
jgi:glycosyltransferase involved in cell wall biosynthesis